MKKRDKWFVPGEFGGTFTNLREARICAKEASKTKEHRFEATVMLLGDGMYYIDYEGGKCVRDGWKIRKNSKHILKR